MKQVICATFVLMMFSIMGCQPTCEELEGRMGKAVRRAEIVASVHGTGRSSSDRMAVYNAITTWDKAEEEFKRCCPEAYKKWKQKPGEDKDKQEGNNGPITTTQPVYKLKRDVYVSEHDNKWNHNNELRIEALLKMEKLYQYNDIKAVDSFVRAHYYIFTTLKKGTNVIHENSCTNYQVIRPHGDHRSYMILDRDLGNFKKIYPNPDDKWTVVEDK